MLRMSASLSWAANPCMTGFLRLPALNSSSCLTMYSGCCCASLGLAGTPELPPAPWQATQTAVNLASPCARSGLAGCAGLASPAGFSAAAAGFSPAAWAWARASIAGAASSAAVSREASNFMSVWRFCCAKPADSTMRPHQPTLVGNPLPMTASPGASASVPSPADKALAWMHTARFLTTAPKLEFLPPHEHPEIAFVGRSNAGKSTCINTLTQQKRLAFASKTPGRTQSINLFSLGKQGTTDAVLADLPGYGYAAVPKQDKLRWQQVMANYLVTRPNLRGVVLLCDPRHGLTELDEILLEVIRPRVEEGLKFLVLLTKADKLNRSEQTKALSIARLQAGGGEAKLFSALKKQGVEETALLLRQWAHQEPSHDREIPADPAP